MTKSDSGKFSWKKGDVQVYKNVADWKRATNKKSVSKPSGGKKK